VARPDERTTLEHYLRQAIWSVYQYSFIR